MISGARSMWYMRIADDPSLKVHQRWVAECVRRGVYFANHHNLFVNYAMTPEDLDYTLEVADDAFRAIKKQK